jgi:hypothetical protein
MEFDHAEIFTVLVRLSKGPCGRKAICATGVVDNYSVISHLGYRLHYFDPSIQMAKK